MDKEKVIKDIYQILGKYGEDREDIKSDFRKLCEYYKTLSQGQSSPTDSVSDIFPPLNTVKQEIEKYNENTIRGKKGHFQNGINWAFNYVSKKVKK